MRPDGKLDDRLMRAMRAGAEALPEDLARLRSYLRMIEGLLAEKAGELEPDWSEALAAAAEVETLQGLEAAVAERAIAVPAGDLEGLHAKFEIWRALLPGAPDWDPAHAHNRLVLSIAADILRLRKAPPG